MKTLLLSSHGDNEVGDTYDLDVFVVELTDDFLTLLNNRAEAFLQGTVLDEELRESHFTSNARILKDPSRTLIRDPEEPLAVVDVPVDPAHELDQDAGFMHLVLSSSDARPRLSKQIYVQWHTAPRLAGGGEQVWSEALPVEHINDLATPRSSDAQAVPERGEHNRR